eukprot:4214284-Prymnesium_polylepis.1
MLGAWSLREADFSTVHFRNSDVRAAELLVITKQVAASVPEFRDALGGEAVAVKIAVKGAVVDGCATVLVIMRDARGYWIMRGVKSARF